MNTLVGRGALEGAGGTEKSGEAGRLQLFYKQEETEDMAGGGAEAGARSVSGRLIVSCSVII